MIGRHQGLDRILYGIGELMVVTFENKSFTLQGLPKKLQIEEREMLSKHEYHVLKVYYVCMQELGSAVISHG
jgi:hypothetical protein